MAHFEREDLVLEAREEELPGGIGCHDRGRLAGLEGPGALDNTHPGAFNRLIRSGGNDHTAHGAAFTQLDIADIKDVTSLDAEISQGHGRVLQ